MSVFPFVEPITETATETLPIPREWAWDFTKNDFAWKNGKMYLVENEEAIKVWAFKVLNTERFKHAVYSWDYGNELTSLIGSGYTKAAAEVEIKRLVDEALYPNEYITGTQDFTIDFDQESLVVTFKINTIYGETEVTIDAN